MNVTLPNVNLTPTMRCNLRCALCGVLVPQYEYRPHMTVQEFSQTLGALFAVVERVGRLQITGGEPLLHPELASMLADCFRYGDRFDELWFFSNCAVPFRQDVLEVLAAHQDQVMVHCSDYGVRPEVSARNLRLLEEAGIRHKYLKYYGEDQYCDGWVDNGDFVPHHRPRAENEAVFAACSHVCRGGSWYIRHGQMHWCGRSIRGTELGKVPLRQEDYLDLLDPGTSVEEKRRQLETLMAVRSIAACDYCGGLYGTEDTAERRPAGEQLEC
nr:hypothetical protein [uncultured Oscillibacter sp.]